jgi:CheY-like chemotaxis protein
MEILLIDDNNEITEMVCFFLDSQNITCTVSNDGKEGLEMIKSGKYDVILLDLTMPEFSGYDIFKDLKQEGLLKQSNIIIFTASYIVDEEVQKMISDGIKGIIKKPVSVDDIVRVIEKFK